MNKTTHEPFVIASNKTITVFVQQKYRGTSLTDIATGYWDFVDMKNFILSI